MAVQNQRSKRITLGDKNVENEINKDNLKLLQRYKRDMQMRELSAASIYNYERDIIQWFKFLVIEQFNPCITELTEDDIEEFIFMCKDEGNNTERIKRRMSSISAFYKFLRKKKVIKENPMEYIDRPKKGLPVVTQTFLTFEQYQLMKQKLIDNEDTQLRLYALFSVSTMARVTAVSSITWEQIDFENRTVDDVLEKEGKIVTLYFSEEVKELFLALKKEREEKGINSPYIFCTKYKGEYKKADVNTLRAWTKKIGEMIGVLSLHPHDFRHSGSQLLKLSGMDIQTISSLLHHENLDTTTKFYLKQDKRMIQKEKDKFSL